MRHHTLLHQTEARPTNSSSTPAIQREHSESSFNATSAAAPICAVASGHSTTLLGTCVVTVEVEGRRQKARALLDSGSHITFASSRLVSSLKAKKTPSVTLVSGIEQTSAPASQFKVDLTLRSIYDDSPRTIDVRAAVVDTITGDLPERALPGIKLPAFVQGLQLADPNFDRPGRIDRLLEMDIFNKVMLAGRSTSEDGELYAHHSVFGWVVSGNCDTPVQFSRAHVCLKSTAIDIQTNNLMTAFWKVEDIGSDASPHSAEEQQPLDHFHSTVTREPMGRYVVQLPRKTPTPKLGFSRELASRRYMQNERSLTRKGQWNRFNTGVKEYADMGHSERVPEQDLKRAEAETFYLTIHGVVKESSTTTKLRIVFDASAKSTTGNSLNDLLLPGPNFYPLLTTVLLRFRQHDIGMSSDISKMFREVGLHPKERDLHRYVTRGDGSSKLEDWRMTRLTFGVTSSPFLATQVLHQVASDYQTEFPQAAEIVKNTFYVDDCLTGASTVEEAITLREELNCLLEKACMRLMKWRSNSNDLLESIPEEMRETENIQVISAPEQCHKALGVHWHTIQDTLHVATPTLVKEDKPTKRQIASDVARTFDILGWYAPAVIKLKILLQQLWQLQLDWDQPVPEDIAREWKSWRDDLHILTDHAIPRCYYKRG